MNRIRSTGLKTSLAANLAVNSSANRSPNRSEQSNAAERTKPDGIASSHRHGPPLRLRKTLPQRKRRQVHQEPL
jgi:hypothetical protein